MSEPTIIDRNFNKLTLKELLPKLKNIILDIGAIQNVSALESCCNYYTLVDDLKTAEISLMIATQEIAKEVQSHER